MFSDRYALMKDEIDSIKHAPVNDIGDLCGNWRETASVLWGDEGARLECVARAETVRDRLFHNQVFAISPLYVTSFCAERCSYCNFRAENKEHAIQRLRLSGDELLREADFLANVEGIRVIELVYATDPMLRIDAISRNVEAVQQHLARTGGGLVGLNAEAFDVHEYEQLRDAGLDFVVLWQETYDRSVYDQVHPGNTKKTRFGYRLDGPERILEAGLRFFGMGVLSGLADWRTDWAFLMAHEAYLWDRYGGPAAILGIPRLKPAEGASLKHLRFCPTDDEFIFVIALHQLFSPSTLPFVNTRERIDLCLKLAKGGGCLFTFNCSTIPGGYTLGSSGYQFPTGSFSASEYGPVLAAHSLIPLMQWTLDDLLATTPAGHAASCA